MRRARNEAGREPVVCYSLFLPNPSERRYLVSQLVLSIESLRAYNKTVPIHVFLYGEIDGLREALARHDAVIQNQGSYEDRLARHLPHVVPVLREHPVLHRFMNFPELKKLRPRQILMLDCDTFFFDDVAKLFSRYTKADWNAREEPWSRRSRHGYRRDYLDEGLLHRLGRTEAGKCAPPFNAGVILLNNRVWERLPGPEILLAYTWRFLLWMALNPVEGAGAEYGELPGVGHLRAHLQELVPQESRYKPLAYPSANRWIVDEVALWLTLGHMRNFTYEDLSARDVLQTREYSLCRVGKNGAIACHYFSYNMRHFLKWAERNGAHTRGSGTDCKIWWS